MTSISESVMCTHFCIDHSLYSKNYVYCLKLNIISSTRNENILQSAVDLRMGWWLIFQQDNDPQHTAKIPKEWLQDNSVIMLERPKQIPDLSGDISLAVHRSFWWSFNGALKRNDHKYTEKDVPSLWLHHQLENKDHELQINTILPTTAFIVKVTSICFFIFNTFIKTST